ncbi:MAG: hypothetical protein ACREBD_31125 [Blastocatellia bacterium]
MKYQKLCLFAFSLMIILAGLVAAQQPSKIKRPVKNPPQFPNIIDLENKDAPPAKEQPGAAQTAPAPVQQPDALTSAMLSLAGELRALGQELRTLNLRGQTQIEMLKMARVDLRIDHYERELRPVRDRLVALEADEQTLLQLMTREALLAQTATAATVNREELMRRLRLQHEARYRATQAEKERLRKLEADLTASLNIYLNLSRDAERKIQEAEGLLQQIESGKTENTQPSQSGQTTKTERKQ